MWKVVAPVVAGLSLLCGLSAQEANASMRRSNWDWCGTPLPVEMRGKLTYSVVPSDKKIGQPGKIDLGLRIVWSITSGGKSYELDFGGDKKLMEQAKKLEGKDVVLTGTRAPGSAIVRVTGLRAAPLADGFIDFSGLDIRSLVGLDVAAARAIATEHGLTFRIVSEDGISFPITLDLRYNRVNVDVVKGKVVAAHIG
jgi:hypothetical protein